MTSPHTIGATAAAERNIAHILDTTPAGATTEQQAARILRELADLGWRPPYDPNDRPPLQGRGAPDNSPGRIAARRVAAELAERPRASFGGTL